ncbi:MAG: DUF4180 domain-containing protein [Chryseobacterium sp.]|nr:MAG: DUF4180 domain-containing protein [Chryseobacterium sp.]
MEIKTHHINNITIAEIISEETVITSVEDALDLVGNLYYQGFDKVVIYEKNLTPDFFDLKNKLAGEILQKFSNYRIRLAVVGDFDKVESNSLRDLISESNKTTHINFVKNIADAIGK